MTTIDDFQKNLSRRPLIELTSGGFANDIPFDGEILTSETDNEFQPHQIIHSSGRLLLLYGEADTVSGERTFHFKYTDTTRLEFVGETTWTVINSGATLKGISMTEMKDGNVAVMWNEWLTNTHYFYARIVDSVGTLVQNNLMFSSVTTEDYYSAPTVLRLQ